MEIWESQILINMKIVGQNIAKFLLVNDFKPMVKASNKLKVAKLYLICMMHHT